MPSRRSPFSWLLRKEWRELMSSTAWWTMCVLIGPLVGVSFITGVSAFGEVSAGAGAACGLACAPLAGVWAPTFGAYEVAAVFLLPFVAIRQVSADRMSGAIKFELQRPISPVVRVLAKAFVLFSAWVIASLPALIAVALWMSYGGSTYAPEVLVVWAGHLLNGALTIALGIAVASITEHPSTAAIVTLAITIGTWLVDFAAVLHGGWWDRLAAWTPSSMLSLFQHGLLQANVVLGVAALVAAALAVAAAWTNPGVPVGKRVIRSVVVAGATAAVVLLCAMVRGSWDASEARMNSFPEPAEEVLERLPALTITVHLAPQDPRRVELERVALSKLRRVVPHLTVTDVARTSSGLYEAADPGYGTVTYQIGDRSTASGVVTAEGVLEVILELARATPEAENETPYPGHPLETRPTGAALTFYGVWPAGAAGLAVLIRRRQV